VCVPDQQSGDPEVLPVFTKLLRRHDLTRTDVLVYGAMVALERAGDQVTVRQISQVAGISTEDDSRQCRVIIRKLERCGLVLRQPRANPNDPILYKLLGPDAECALVVGDS